MGNEFYQLSGDAQRALEEFSQDFAGALAQGDVEEWAKENGRYKESRVLKTTWPIPVSAAGYQKLEGDLKYRDLFAKSISLINETWQDGVAALASVVEAPDFMGWDAEPEAMAAAKKSLLNRIIVTALEANATHPLDNVAFFSNSHPCNVFDSSIGTFDNLFAGAGTEPTAANVKLAAEAFRSIKAPNGQPGGYRLTHILAPGVWEEELRDILETSIVITTTGTSFGATDNRLKGRAKLIISDELSGNFWYPLSLNKPGAYPWCVQDEGIPEEILSDKSSEMYKRTLKVGVAYVVRANGGLALPHCIQRWEGTA